jgi:integrase
LDELDMKVGADGKTRSLYSWRHYYATQDLKRGVSTHALSKQMGNSTTMLDKHYSKYSPLLNAELHSGRQIHKNAKLAAEEQGQTIAELAFAMLKNGQLDEAGLLAAIGVGRDGYIVTEEVAMKALAAKRDEHLSAETLLRILNG